MQKSSFLKNECSKLLVVKGSFLKNECSNVRLNCVLTSLPTKESLLWTVFLRGLRLQTVDVPAVSLMSQERAPQCTDEDLVNDFAHQGLLVHPERVSERTLAATRVHVPLPASPSPQERAHRRTVEHPMDFLARQSPAVERMPPLHEALHAPQERSQQRTWDYLAAFEADRARIEAAAKKGDVKKRVLERLLVEAEEDEEDDEDELDVTESRFPAGWRPMQMCWLFLAGNCRRGMGCTFAHHVSEMHLQERPPRPF